MTDSSGLIGFTSNYMTNTCDEDASILRGPYQIALDITNRCNFRCMHCYNASGENFIKPSNELSDEQVLDLVADIATMQPYNFCFCGGETLLRKDLLIKAARILKRGCRYVSMVTNGYLVTPEIAKEVVSSGITRVQVSLDGAGAGSHDRLRRQEGAFEKAVQAIKAFTVAGVQNIEVAFCPTAFNVHELPEVHKLCKSLGVGSLRVQPLMLLGRANKYANEIVPTYSQYRELVRMIDRITKSCDGPLVEWGDPIDHLIRFRTLVSACVPYVNIKADGSIVPSPYIPVSVGNVTKHKLSEYWEAGLIRAWQEPLVTQLASKVLSVSDFCKVEEGTPMVWLDADLQIDLIELRKLQIERVQFRLQNAK
ncbi:MAG: radical SAM protein [Actinomycetota bacterium]